MHSFHGKSCTIHYNSDMSGDIHIIQEHTENEVKVDGEDILKFVAEFIRSEKIGKLEQTDWKEILQ